MATQQEKDEAIERAGKILLVVYDDIYGYIKFNFHCGRKTVHANIMHTIEVEICENKQLGGKN